MDHTDYSCGGGSSGGAHSHSHDHNHGAPHEHEPDVTANTNHELANINNGHTDNASTTGTDATTAAVNNRSATSPAPQTATATATSTAAESSSSRKRDCSPSCNQTAEYEGEDEGSSPSSSHPPPPYQRPRINSNSNSNSSELLTLATTSARREQEQDAASGIISLAIARSSASGTGGTGGGGGTSSPYPTPTTTAVMGTASPSPVVYVAPNHNISQQQQAMQNTNGINNSIIHHNNTINTNSLLQSQVVSNSMSMPMPTMVVVHLSITQSKPSFIEPWKTKGLPVSLVGMGIVVPWSSNTSTTTNSDLKADLETRAGVAGGKSLMEEGNADDGKLPAAEAEATMPGNAGPTSTSTSANNASGRQHLTPNDVHNDVSSIRILTNACTVQHATSIRARLVTANNLQDSSWSSIGCKVEWMSLSMDLAVLTIDIKNSGSVSGSGSSSSWWNNASSGLGGIGLLNPIPMIIASHLPSIGTEVKWFGFPTQHEQLADLSTNNNGLLSQQQRHVELTTQEGNVMGYSAKEKEHHLLRMKVGMTSNKRGGGGIVVDGNGHILGLTASSSSSSSSLQHEAIIPGVVIHRFLENCKSDKKVATTSVTAATVAAATASVVLHPSFTDGEGSGGGATSARDTGDETSVYSNWLHQNRTKTTMNSTGVNFLPGIPTLGITGFQTLENKALRRTLGLMEAGGGVVVGGCHENENTGVRILGINHTVHPTIIDNDVQSHSCKEDKKCHTSMLRTDDVLLAVNDEPIRSDGTIKLLPGRENERVDFRWLISQQAVGSMVKLDVMRHRKRMVLYATMSAPRYLVPKWYEEGDGDVPSYVICGGCVFVPLTQNWLLEMAERQQLQLPTYAGTASPSSSALPPQLQGFQRYLQEQRKGDQQIIILSHVLPDDVNVGYHGLRNMVLTAVNGQRSINNIHHLMDMLVKREMSGQSLEFRCSYVHLDRAKVVIAMDSKEVMNSEIRILKNYMIGVCYSANALSPALKKEAEGKAHRHGVTYGLKTIRALCNAVRETTLVVRRPPIASAAAAAAGADGSDAVAATRRIMDWSETHKMQSAPLFSGKYTEEGGWTQVKTKHLSQLCSCGKSTRFYCICTVGVMRCKDCFIQHCRDHTGQHECSQACAPDCEGVTDNVLTEGVELVTTKKRKRNNPTQAIQSRCVVCKAKTCYSCSACGFEKEVALCHVSTGRNCLPIHISELHGSKKCSHDHDLCHKV